MYTYLGNFISGQKLNVKGYHYFVLKYLPLEPLYTVKNCLFTLTLPVDLAPESVVHIFIGCLVNFSKTAHMMSHAMRYRQTIFLLVNAWVNRQDKKKINNTSMIYLQNMCKRAYMCNSFIVDSRGYDSVIRRMQSWVCLLYNLYNTHEFILHMTPGSSFFKS